MHVCVVCVMCYTSMATQKGVQSGTSVTSSASTWVAAQQIMICARWMKRHSPPECLFELFSDPRNGKIKYVLNAGKKGAVFTHAVGGTFRGLTRDMANVFWDEKKIPPRRTRRDQAMSTGESRR